MDCGNLVEIRCPDSVRRVASGAFEGCKSLERFILTQYSQLTVVEEGAFKGCCISNFTIPKYFSVEESDLTGILSLGENYSEKYCVQECFIMSRNKNILFRVVGEHDVISIPSAVRIIQSLTYYHMLSNKEIVNFSEVTTDPDSALSRIELTALEGCYIENLRLPKSVEDISGVSRKFVRNVEFEVGNPYFECFDDMICSSDSTIMRKYFGTCKEFVIPCYIEKLGFRCFYKDSFIEYVSFEEGSEVTEFPEEAFAESSVAHVDIPDSLRVMGKKCFAGCQILENISFGEESQLETIGEGCFEMCEKLEKIEVPESVNEIQKSAFESCKCKTITLLSRELKTLPRATFRASDITEITIPRSVVEIEDSCFEGCKNLTQVRFEEGSMTLRLGMMCFSETAITSICIPRSVNTISHMCFKSCMKLQNVTFEEGSELTKIGWQSFSETGIESLCLPKSIMIIEGECFSRCKKLRELRFEEASVIEELKKDLFGKVSSDVKVFIPKSIQTLTV